MNVLSIITGNIIRALSSTFIYSLWQGLILAALAGLVVLLTRKSTSAKRYNLLVGLLACFAVAISVTFIVQFIRASGEHYIVINGQFRQEFTTVLDLQNSVAPQEDTAGGSVLAYLNGHAEMIVMIWFLIVCARCLQLLTGLHGLQRLRKESISIGKEWEEKLVELADAIGVRRKVMMAGSVLAKVPMVIGHIKPVILIPMSLLTAMQPAEIEAVLIHELAHIRRRDYLVNMLQHLMEIVFFFNPAVLWISSLIKAERENCCDDITLKQTGDKAAYIRALVSCQEFQLQTPKMAIGLPGRKNLLGRVSRMVSSHNHSLSVFEKSLLAVCLVAAGLTLAAFSRKPEKKQPTSDSAQSASAIRTKIDSMKTIEDHSLPGFTEQANRFRIYQPVEVGEGTSCYIGDVDDLIGYQTYLLKKEDVLYQLNYIKGKLSSLQVNGKDIPTPQWVSYKERVQQLTGDHEAKAQRLFKQQLPDTIAAEDIFDRAEKTLRNGVNRTKDAIDEAGMALGRSIRELDVKERVKTAPAKEELALPVNTQISTTTSIKTTVSVEYNKDDYYAQQYQPLATYPRSYKTGLQKEYRAQAPEKKEWIKVEELIARMIEENVVKKAEDVKSFMISPQQMIMNGKIVPEEIHRMLLDKYIKADTKMKWAIYYNFDTSTIKSITRNGINAD
ncbi:MAG: hypothetical protein DI535_17420 [Citrobacter freundii]|nr:MAG: hypothetical protein DI535_17420 [Citrobacter freundii]